MIEMDLVPGDYRCFLSLRSTLRRVLVAIATLIVLVIAARGLLIYLSWQEQTRIAGLEHLKELSDRDRATADGYRQRKQAVGGQLAALDALRGRDRVAALVHAIDAAYGEGIWFDGLRLLRRGTPSPAAAINPGGLPSADAQGAEITGHAYTHSLLAEFMRRLGAQSGVADLRLVDTKLRTYTTGQVIDFNISLQLAGTSPVREGRAP